MVDKIINVLKEKPIIISSKIFYNYKKLNMNEQDLILLMFLLNTNDNIFNPQNIATNLNVDLKVVMESVNNLVSNNLITIETISENGIKDIINFNGDIVYRVYYSRSYEIMREEVIYLCINGGKSYGIEY